MTKEHLDIWTVYFNPKDHPNKLVARRSEVGSGPDIVATSDMFVADSLEELRALLPPGLHCLQRLAHDDPVIVEVWL